MKFEVVDAKREQIPLKIGITGLSGSGKTYSSLLLARGLTDSWSKVAVLDSENNSASLYSDICVKHSYDQTVFKTLNGGFKPPYSPANFIEAISFWERQPIDVLVVDSCSKEWEAVLEMVESINGNSRFQMAGWKQLTPEHNRFIEKIVNSPLHIITTLRSKSEYAMEQDQGKVKPRKIGMKPVQREGFEYELTLHFYISQNHHVTCEKDRTSLFMGRHPFVLNEQHGKELLDWSNSGAPIAPQVFYTGTGPEKILLSKIMKELGIKKAEEMIEIAHLIKESRVPMDDFEPIATKIINEFLEGKSNAS